MKREDLKSIQKVAFNFLCFFLLICSIIFASVLFVMKIGPIGILALFVIFPSIILIITSTFLLLDNIKKDKFLED